jgi:hypothetical protein
VAGEDDRAFNQMRRMVNGSEDWTYMYTPTTRG